MMKKIFLGLALATMVVPSLSAKEIAAGNKVNSDINLTINNIAVQGDNLFVDMNLDLSQVNLERNKEVIYMPMFYNGADTLKFTPFTVAGKYRYIWHERNGQLTPVLFKGWGKEHGEMSQKSIPQGPDYQFTNNGAANYNLLLCTPYLPWMETSMFGIESQTIGCADCGEKEVSECDLAQLDFRPAVFESDFIFVTPVAETVKTRELSGRAYVDFQVNKTNILPDYRNNKVELGKIIATIDSVKNDKDITVTSIQISGTASPEGSYENNVRLAKGRTEALVEYVQNLYQFPKGFIKTSYEPVDWAGLKEWLENNPIDNRDAILAIVDGDLEPFARNQKIKTTYPKQYQFLLENVYPSLRHSDYVIEYNIRNYANAEEIIEVMTTSPSKLSLNELFIVANNQPEGSDIYNESFEIAVKMYPEDETANLNAATNAIKRGDFSTAKKYLEKAGKSDEAQFTRAEYEALNGDKAAALATFKQLAKTAKSDKVREKAAKAAESLELSMKKAGSNYTVLD